MRNRVIATLLTGLTVLTLAGPALANRSYQRNRPSYNNQRRQPTSVERPSGTNGRTTRERFTIEPSRRPERPPESRPNYRRR